MSEIIIGKDAADTARLLEKRQTALKVVDSILAMPRPQRWIAARNVWVSLTPWNAQAHREACQEVAQARKMALDPKYGRSKSALGINYGAKTNKNTSMRMVAIFPEPEGKGGLIDFLKRVDPEFLALPSGKEYKRNWRKVYKAMPEYVVPEQIDYDEGR